MPLALDQQNFQSRLRRLEEMLVKVERLAEPAARACTSEIVQCVLELHGTGLQRMLDHLGAAGAAGQSCIDEFARDEVISGLLLLHNLHPLALEERVRQALQSARPHLRSHGGNVELLAIEDGVVRLRLQGSCHGCPSSAVTLRQMIETAILEQAPDAVGVEVEGLDDQAEPAIAEANGNGRYHLPVLAG